MSLAEVIALAGLSVATLAFFALAIVDERQRRRLDRRRKESWTRAYFRSGRLLPILISRWRKGYYLADQRDWPAAADGQD